MQLTKGGLLHTFYQTKVVLTNNYFDKSKSFSLNWYASMSYAYGYVKSEILLTGHIHWGTIEQYYSFSWSNLTDLYWHDWIVHTNLSLNLCTCSSGQKQRSQSKKKVFSQWRHWSEWSCAEQFMHHYCDSPQRVWGTSAGANACVNGCSQSLISHLLRQVDQSRWLKRDHYWPKPVPKYPE